MPSFLDFTDHRSEALFQGVAHHERANERRQIEIRRETAFVLQLHAGSPGFQTINALHLLEVSRNRSGYNATIRKFGNCQSYTYRELKKQQARLAALVH